MNKKQEELLSDEAVVGLKGLAEILRRIHNRLIREGYRIEDGLLYASDGKVEYRRKVK